MIADTNTGFDILSFSQSKIDSTFPNMLFKINGYKPLRRDHNKFYGGLMCFFLNEEIPCKFLNSHPIVPNAKIVGLNFIK